MRLGAAALLVALAPNTLFAEPLPSWNDGDTKTAILGFVDSVTDATCRSATIPS